jgi:hypothetical protein
MNATANRFLRRTTLHGDEYRTNFRQIDCDVIETLTSDEAGLITSQMSKVYLRLVNAPAEYWEREGVLRFAGDEIDGKFITAWEQLISMAGVASATARKAIKWMNEQGIIGYYAGRNGVGIRVFINRAASSVGHKAQSVQKNLRLVQASTRASRTSRNDVPFNDSFAVLDNLDTDIDPGAPKNGADTKLFDKFTSTPPVPDARTGVQSAVEHREIAEKSADAQHIALGEIVARLKSELEPNLRSAAAQAAAQATRSEIERTRVWFETRALPKAVRVAQSECYSLLKKHGSLDEQSKRLRAGLDLGRHVSAEVVETAKPCTSQEISEIAEVCLALLETQGQAIDVTLCEVSKEGGGWLLPEDAPRVRAAAELMLVRRARGD